MRVLITGFDPFGGASINPAYEAVKLLPDIIGSAEVIKMEIPTVFYREGEILEEGTGPMPSSVSDKPEDVPESR